MVAKLTLLLFGIVYLEGLDMQLNIVIFKVVDNKAS